MYMYVVMKDSNICRHICMCTIFNLYVYTHPKKYAHMWWRCVLNLRSLWRPCCYRPWATNWVVKPSLLVCHWLSQCRTTHWSWSGLSGIAKTWCRLIDWLMDWLIDGLMDWLIDWLMDWWIDWLIDGLMDWLIDWLILMICMILMRFIVITLAVMMLTVCIKLKARSRSGQLATYEPR